MTSKPARGGGRWVEVPAVRLKRWLQSFHERHCVVRTEYRDDTITEFTAADSDVAECHVPLGPHRVTERFEGFVPEQLLKHCARPRIVGVLLVRLGGYAVGVFNEQHELVASKVGTRPVHGRNRKGGSSSGRFARRRENQARDLVKAAADTAHRILEPYGAKLDALIAGGDRTTAEAVLADPRLVSFVTLRTDPFLTVPDPKLAILQQAPELFTVTRIRLS